MRISQPENQPLHSLKQILQDVNGKFEVGTAYFPKVKSSDEGGVSIGGASLWALNNNDLPEARATVESQIESLLNGDQNVDETVSNMADAINKSIEEYNLVNN